MTGWAAVQGGSAASWERHLALDVWYVDNWSLALDLKILLMAVVNILRHENTGAKGLPGRPSLDRRVPPDIAPQAVQVQAPLLAPAAAGWRIKRVHERAKSVG